MNALRLLQDRAGRPALQVTSEQVWREVEEASFAVLGHVTPAGRPRSSGVMFAVAGRRLFVAVGADSWKARQIADGDEVAVTVPVRRGGLLAWFVPIPPATISFHARVRVHPAGSVGIGSRSRRLAALLPRDGRDVCLLELVPEGEFLTYGVGVSLRTMARPADARAHAPV